MRTAIELAFGVLMADEDIAYDGEVVGRRRRRK